MGKRKTHDEFLKKAFEKNNKVNIIGKYVTNDTKITVECKKCKYVWNMLPGNIYKNGGCPICNGNKKKTHDEFVKELNEINPSVKPLGIYKRYNEKMDFECVDCGLIWNTRISSVFSGCGCPGCGKEKISKSKTLTNEEYENRFIKNAKSNVKMLSKYNCSREKIKLGCIDCGYEWEAFPLEFLRLDRGSCGCPSCEGILVNTDTINRRLFEKYNGNIELNEEYQSSSQKASLKCNVCGHIWKQFIQNVLTKNSCGCPNCTENERIKKGREKLVNYLENTNPFIEIIGDFTKRHEKIKCFCKRCNQTFYSLPSSLYADSGCPNCIMSSGERKIANYLIRNHIKYETQKRFKDCKHKGQLPFDFYIHLDNNKSFLCEFDGQQHFEIVDFTYGKIPKEKLEENLKIVQLRDSIKNKYCEDNNIPLLRISYLQGNNIEQILSNFIKQLTLENNNENDELDDIFGINYEYAS